MKSPLTRCRISALPARVGFLALIGVLTPAAAATTQDRYYAHFHDSGMVEDNIDGGQITAREWSELISFGPILSGLEILAWLPEVFAPAPQRFLDEPVQRRQVEVGEVLRREVPDGQTAPRNCQTQPPVRMRRNDWCRARPAKRTG